VDQARAGTETVLQQLASQLSGLSAAVAESRLTQYGPNEIAREKTPSALIRLLRNVKNPLVILLTALGMLSFVTVDQRATVVIS
jgi:Mg2+-importing ATPase